MVYQWIKKLQPVLFPSTCRLCRAPGLPGLELCPACRAELPWIAHSCRRCALPLPRNAGITICFDCINTQRSLDRCTALFEYRPPVDRWIQNLKFSQDLAAAGLLGQLLAGKIPANNRERPATALPVPLHRKRLSERGYNQALEIARSLPEKGYRLDPTCCRRHKATSAQSNLPASARKGNVRNAFSVSLPMEGSRLLLIDDVMTTGATLNELARTLKNAGAERVDAWVIARTGQKNG
jgi:ComF family protein